MSVITDGTERTDRKDETNGTNMPGRANQHSGVTG